MKHDKLEYERSVGPLRRVECRSILTKALAASGISSENELAELTGIDVDTLELYFTARKKPDQNDWNIIATYLSPNGKYFSPKLNAKELKSAIHHSDKTKVLSQSINAMIFLIKDELDYFKDKPAEVREILKRHFNAEHAGYTISLFQALYNEDELEVWKMFDNNMESIISALEDSKII